MDNIIRYKCVLLGNENVGKSSIIHRYIKKEFSSSIITTVGCSYNCHEVKISKKNIKLDLWDTAGQERYRSILPMYYRNANIILICVDLSRDNIIESFKYWFNEVEQVENENKIIILVGTKSDIKKDYNDSIIQTICEESKLDYFETSALDNSNIDTLFLESTEKIYNLHDKPEEEHLVNINLEELLETTPPESFLSRFCPKF